MADYQEYRRHVLHRRWRRMFTTFLALVLLVSQLTGLVAIALVVGAAQLGAPSFGEVAPAIGAGVASNPALVPLADLGYPVVDPALLNGPRVVELMTAAGII